MTHLGLTIEELHALLVAHEVTPLDLVKEVIAAIKQDDNNAFEYVMEKEAIEAASKLKEVEVDNPLWGIPFVVKDNISTKDVPTTASSNILNGYVPIFDAEVITRLKAQKAIMVAKATLDELAMGGTGTTGHLGVTHNPYDKTHERIVGGSSCGSAASVASGLVSFSLASDTGDSTRKPASYAGLVGLKPTWGRISRYGLFPFAPSLDTYGIFSRSVKDAGYVLNVLSGRDEKDATSSTEEVKDYNSLIGKDVKHFKVAVIRQIVEAVEDEIIVKTFNETIEKLKLRGVQVDYVDMDKTLLESLFPTYFVLSCAEATSNNANLDGIKFGPYYDGASYQEVMLKARTKGFSELIKRRFVFGSFALMKENQNDLFIRAERNRRRIVEATNKVLEQYDFIYTIAAPSIAPKLNESSDRLSDKYLIADNHLVLGNFAGLPSITLPIGTKDNMPFGANLMGRAFKEDELLQISQVVEDISGLKNMYAKREAK